MKVYGAVLWSLLAGFARAEAPLQTPAVEAPAPPPSARVRIVYTGGSGGVGSTKYNFEMLRVLDAMEGSKGLKLETVRAVHGVLAQGELALWAEDASVASAVRFLEAAEVRCEPGPPIAALSSGPELVFAEGDGAWMAEITGRAVTPVARLRCEADGQRVLLSGPPEALSGEISFELERWEFRRGIQGTVRYDGADHPFTSVGRPLAELARTAAMARRLLDETPGALYVDAGDLLDGASSVADGALSLHRPTDLWVAGRLGPSALVPGNNELLAGAAAFFREIEGAGLPYVATNWRSEDAALALPASALVEVATPAGPVSVAFLGALDPAMAAYIPALAAEGVTLTEPVAALQAEVDRLRAQDEPPDAIVLLTTADAALMEQVRRSVRGVDVLIGDPTFATLRVQQAEVDLRPLPRTAKGAAITLPMDGLAVLDLDFDGPDSALTRVTATPVLAPASLPPDPEVLRRITEVRARVYPSLDRPLLDAPQPTEPLPAALWEAVVCEAVREQTHADTVLIRALPPPPRTPGPLTEMMVADALALLDVLELHRVPGANMASFLASAQGEAPVTCGAKPGASSPRARGRYLESTRSYAVVTTDRTRLSTGLDSMLRSARSAYPLEAPGWGVIEQDGAPLTLRRAALEGLRAARDAAGSTDGLVAHLTEVAPAQVSPLWLLRVDALSLSGARLEGVNDDAFSDVPETLATAPSSSALSAEADLSLAFGSGRLSQDLRFRGAFGLLAYDGSQATETADDALLSTSLALPGHTWPGAGPLRLMPYSELRLDSEFTPTEGNPRQADLSLLAGVSAAKTSKVLGFHLGAFINEDLSEAPGVEPGLRLDFATYHPFGGGYLLRLSTLGDLQVYARTAHDDASDLRVRAAGTVKLGLPVAWWLDLSLSASGFAMQGRVPETAAWGLSHTLGVSLDARRVFEL